MKAVEFIIGTELAASALASRVYDSNACYIVMSHALKKEDFGILLDSTRYWWKAVHKMGIGDGVGLLTLERKRRGINVVETYGGSNYYHSERLGVGSYMIHELEATRFIRRACPDAELVIELGGFHGGLTLQLSDVFPDSEIHSFDVRLLSGMKNVLEVVGEKSNITFYKESVLSVANENVLKLVKDGRRKILYCDNGHKAAEIKMYAPYLSVGDVLGVHDWGVELKMKHIKGTLINFTPVFWDKLKKLKLLTRLWEKVK